ncbi:MAG: FeoA domain-containing protein [Chthonomonas sp.]|nr:FeoA domain-containing protein [Chthonomonas sp.]
MTKPTTKIASLKKGAKARVVENCAKCEMSCRLQEMGLVKGTVFQVIKVAPLGDPLEISFRNQRLCVRKGECGDIVVELIED